MMITHLFVYGTLLMGGPYHNLLAPYTTAMESATADGMDLYLVSDWYPGMVRGKGTVAGEVAELDPLQLDAVLDVLDEFENYKGPGHTENQYDRVVIPVQTADGRQVEAWAYLWIGPTTGCKQVPQGDWRLLNPKK